MTTIVETQPAQPATLSLADFVRDFGPALREAVDQQNPPVFHPEDTCPLRDAVMDGLLRQPFPAQRDVVQAVSALLFDRGEKAAIINAEMGTGKTQMAICTAAVAQAEGYQRSLVICPPHLVYKWRREIKETVPNARVWVLNGADTLARLLQLRQWMKEGYSDVPEFFVMGRVRMRLGYEWTHAFARKRIIGRNGDGQEQEVYAYEVLACPKCGTPYRNEDGDTYRSERFLPEKRLSCQHRHVDGEGHTHVCGEQLWSLVRKEALKDKRKLVMDALKKLPTIGDKTAERLVSTFGEDMLGDMLSDNLYEFTNLMDDSGELVFSDRQAERMERSLSKLEFSLGQGGYQASEFIKRQLPDGYFGMLVVDECHEYKNADSAQGQAFGVLAAKASKVLLLTGTLMGGYADDLFHLLWRANPRRMIEDGYRYRNRSLGGAVMAFMRDHGILKDVFKSTTGCSHKTARGDKSSQRTSKAPGFGPTGICRFVLPYTVFLKLREIGQNVLPSYDEHYVEVAMDDEQRDAYEHLSANLTTVMRQALAKGDSTLLGVVLNALLRWPETCFRAETVKHPRTREVLASVEKLYADDGLTPKEQKLLAICQEEKAKGRRVLVYTTYTGTQDTSSRLKSILTAAGFRTDVLRSTVATDQREDWILDRVDRGIDVLVCNPELVKTGLDLLEFPTIVFMQTGYNVYSLQQAARRSWRIGQRVAVNVYFLGYEQTAQTACLALMAEKIAVSQSTSGDMPDTGLDVLNPNGDSVEMALAKRMLQAV
ncbi:MAG TPA: SNF2-related protein [Candidatus Thiothrix moscowensis]|uniref:DEAD/DEAH box helicase family protein n=1 Tax=unclassified Thiothrix TaxID=2636184 RepID=UPI0025E5254D|nr:MULTISPECIES: DEAD/DEAH box helicase family protein [unclassified Thiothrix]HRJ52224.1 SNF2-related protein [Candidatus Thiothrix moscowensis]HRJ92539.1 SNF2-related protein [Candidatus Thiothrix moscowensis]